MVPLGVIKLWINFFIFYKFVRVRIDCKNIFIGRSPDESIRTERQVPNENRIDKFGNIQRKLRYFLLFLNIPYKNFGLLLAWRGAQSSPNGR
ncbi:hypothetical protein D3C72_1066980 [compost metagenome]